MDEISEVQRWAEDYPIVDDYDLKVLTKRRDQMRARREILYTELALIDLRLEKIEVRIGCVKVEQEIRQPSRPRQVRNAADLVGSREARPSARRTREASDIWEIDEELEELL